VYFICDLYRTIHRPVQINFWGFFVDGWWLVVGGWSGLVVGEDLGGLSQVNKVTL